MPRGRWPSASVASRASGAALRPPSGASGQMSKGRAQVLAMVSLAAPAQDGFHIATALVRTAAWADGCFTQANQQFRSTPKQERRHMPEWHAYYHWLNPGDNAWQMTAATLVGLMSVPGLA